MPLTSSAFASLIFKQRCNLKLLNEFLEDTRNRICSAEKVIETEILSPLLQSLDIGKRQR